MATAIELAALATRSTTTAGGGAVQPYEVETIAQGAAVDLDATAADERVVNLALTRERVDNGLHAPILEVAIEASAESVGPWTEVARFTRCQPGDYQGVEEIGFVSPSRYIRATWRIGQRDAGVGKSSVRFGVAGKKS